jgi:antitoxin (DNA-binding transcriptional repressor) of toxin-antitoxin stability system
MVRQVALEDLQEHLEEYVDAAANGTTIHVTKQGLTVANITPPTQERAALIEPTKRLHDFTPGPRPKNLTVDPAQILIDERERERNGSKDE